MAMRRDQEVKRVQDILAEHVPKVLDLLLEKLGLRLLEERTPDYTAYELVDDDDDQLKGGA